MSKGDSNTRAFPWSEIVLLLILTALLFALLPELGEWLICNPGNWPRWVWMSLNVIAIGVLFVLRFAPDLYDQWLQRRARLKSKWSKQEKQREAREHREMLQRMREARKRQVV